jgi:DNA-binding transcriptional ArsR family regulator
MPRRSEHGPAARRLPLPEAQELAETLKAVASPTRLGLLVELLGEERTVAELSEALALGQSATSHHLRILRALRLVRPRRAGRHVYYALHDHHIAELLAAIRHHHEHVHPSAPVARPKRRAERAVLR